MKSLVHLGQQLLVAGVAIAGSTLGFGMQALALPQEAIVQKLRNVPMYMLFNDEEQPIVFNVQNEAGETESLTEVFVSPSDAQNLIAARVQEVEQLIAEEQAKTNRNPEILATLNAQAALWKETQTGIISLADIYLYAENEDSNLNFQFVPSAKQFQSASEYIEEGDQLYGSVPLFLFSLQALDEGGNPITDGQGNSVRVYPTLERDGKIPLYFDAEAIEQQTASLVNSDREWDIEVITLEMLLNKLVTDDLSAEEEEFLNEMTLVPPEESVRLIMQQQRQQSGN